MSEGGGARDGDGRREPPAISYEFHGALAEDEDAQRAIKERFERAFAERLTEVTAERSSELAFVDAWRDVRTAFPEWADSWGASRAGSD